MYKTKILGTTAACATAGWFYGQDQQPSNASTIPNASHYAKYTEALRAQGYVPIDQAKPFFQMHRPHMFTHAILSGHNRLSSETHMQKPTGEIISLFHIGSEIRSTDQFPTVCTTLFDECLAKAAFQKLPNKIGVTGTLEIDQIKQLPAGGDGYIAVHARPTASKGRKAEAEGYINVVSTGEKIAAARVIMIEPSWAKYLSYFA